MSYRYGMLTNPDVGTLLSIYRREEGQTPWDPRATNLGTFTFTDTVAKGTRYEYQADYHNRAGYSFDKTSTWSGSRRRR